MITFLIYHNTQHAFKTKKLSCNKYTLSTIPVGDTTKQITKHHNTYIFNHIYKVKKLT